MVSAGVPVLAFGRSRHEAPKLRVGRESDPVRDAAAGFFRIGWRVRLLATRVLRIAVLLILPLRMSRRFFFVLRFQRHRISVSGERRGELQQLLSGGGSLAGFGGLLRRVGGVQCRIWIHLVAVYVHRDLPWFSTKCMREPPG